MPGGVAERGWQLSVRMTGNFWICQLYMPQKHTLSHTALRTLDCCWCFATNLKDVKVKRSRCSCRHIRWAKKSQSSSDDGAKSWTTINKGLRDWGPELEAGAADATRSKRKYAKSSGNLSCNATAQLERARECELENESESQAGG